MTAYGAYGHAQPPVFDRTVLSLIDRGFVYAITTFEVEMNWVVRGTTRRIAREASYLRGLY
jgi:hypothetical protein